MNLEGELVPYLGHLTWGSWAWIRIWALLRVHPVWGRTLGATWWLVSAAAAFVLVVAIAPLHVDAMPSAWPGFEAWAWVAIGEFAIGSLWGWLVALPTYALLGAGSEIRDQFAGATASDALVISISTVGLALGFALGVHRPLVLAIVDGLNAVPIAANEFGPWLDEAPQKLARVAHGAMTLSLSLATPLLLTLAVTDTVILGIGKGFGVDGEAPRAALQWLRLAFALLALGASWLTFPYMWSRAWA